MRFEPFIAVDEALQVADEQSLWELYHENSKLFVDSARRAAEAFGGSPYELFVTSRGFKQYRDAPRVPLPGLVRTEGALGEVLAARRSTRSLGAPVGLAALGTVLQQGLGPSALVHQRDVDVVQMLRTWPSAGGLYPIDTYVVAAKVEGLAPGIYHYNVVTAELERMADEDAPEDVLSAGFFWQEFAVTAAVCLLFTAVFDRTVSKYGERGYRLVLLDAGHAAQNVLLTAQDLRLPAVPVAGFCDDALASALRLDGVHESVLHSVLIGGPVDEPVAQA